MIQYCKGKGSRAVIMKLVVVETIYGIWKYHNEVTFGKDVNNTNIHERIIDVIVHRAWNIIRLRDYITRLII